MSWTLHCCIAFHCHWSLSLVSRACWRSLSGLWWQHYLCTVLWFYGWKETCCNSQWRWCSCRCRNNEISADILPWMCWYLMWHQWFFPLRFCQWVTCTYLTLFGNLFNIIVDAWPEDRILLRVLFSPCPCEECEFFSGYPSALMWKSLSFPLWELYRLYRIHTNSPLYLNSLLPCWSIRCRHVN